MGQEPAKFSARPNGLKLTTSTLEQPQTLPPQTSEASTRSAALARHRLIDTTWRRRSLLVPVLPAPGSGGCSLASLPLLPRLPRPPAPRRSPATTSSSQATPLPASLHFPLHVLCSFLLHVLDPSPVPLLASCGRMCGKLLPALLRAPWNYIFFCFLRA
jgi:hypothetical protein